MNNMLPDQLSCQLLGFCREAMNMAFSLWPPACMCSTENPLSSTTSFTPPAQFCMLMAMAALTALRPGLLSVTLRTATGKDESLELLGINGLHPSTFAVRGNAGSASSTCANGNRALNLQ